MLIGELDTLDAEDQLITWAERRLSAKNTLGADDARMVEATYRTVLERVCGAGRTANSPVVDAQNPFESGKADPLADGPVVRCQSRSAGAAKLVWPLFGRNPVWSASASLAMPITCNSPKPGPWAARSATNSPCLFAAITTMSCTAMVMSSPGGPM